MGGERKIKWKTSKREMEMSRELCLPMCFPLYFLSPSEFCAAAAVLAPRWEREQCLSEINTTQREHGERGREQTDGERQRDRVKEDRADQIRGSFKVRETFKRQNRGSTQRE